MKNPRALPFLLLVILMAGSFTNRSPKLAHAQSDLAPCCGPETPREFDFAYYNVSNGFTSSLILIGNSPKPIPLSVAVRGAKGGAAASTLTLQPNQKLSMDVRTIILKGGGDPDGAFKEGNIAVEYMGTRRAVVGQLTLLNAHLRLDTESEMVENDAGESTVLPVLRSLWWGLAGGRDARVAVTNVTSLSATADVSLDFDGKVHRTDPITVPAFGTEVFSVAELLSGLGYSPSQVPAGGISIVQRGPNPGLIAHGEVTDPAAGFSTTLEFPDPRRQQRNALHAIGLPIGAPTPDSPYSGPGFFTPHVIVRNLTDRPQAVTVTLEYPKSAAWNSTNWAGGPVIPVVPVGGPLPKGSKKNPNEALDHHLKADPAAITGEFKLAPVGVGPYSTVDDSLDAVVNQLPQPVPFCTIRIQYSGLAGSMIAQVSSVDAGRSLVIDARTANDGDGWAGSGADAWHLDEGTDSILFLTDMGDRPARIGFFVTAGNAHYYLTSLELAARETRAINIRQLRDAQKADFMGNKVPATATDGSVNWIRISGVPVTGRVLMIRRSGGTASDFDPGGCPCPTSYSGVVVSPTPVVLGARSSSQEYAQARYTDCNGQNTYNYVGATWSVCPTCDPGWRQ